MCRRLWYPGTLLSCLLVAGCLPGPGGRRPSATGGKPPQNKPAGEFNIDTGTLPVDVKLINPTRFYAEFADLLLLWHCDDRWKAMSPAVEFLKKGAKSRVDTDFGKIVGKTISVKRGSKRPWDVIGDGNDGRLAEDDDLGCEVYRDPKGEARLVLLVNRLYNCDTIVLSVNSSHPARVLPHSLMTVKTPSGLHLGSRRAEVEAALGQPSREFTFRNAQVLWYLSRPEAVKIDQSEQLSYRGYSSAFALRHGEVVEIMLHAWSEELGG